MAATKIVLTDQGWPRPIIGGLPIPWIAIPENLAQVDKHRMMACASGAICQVCGFGYQPGDEAFALVKSKTVPRPKKDHEVQAMDNGIMHKRCLILALKHCPELKMLREKGLLQVVRTTGNSAKPRRQGAGLYARITKWTTVKIGALVKNGR